MTANSPRSDTDVQIDSPSTAVVVALAEAKGIDPIELETPLYDVINPEALDMLFESRTAAASESAGVVSFTIDGYEVTVTSNQEVTVTPEGAADAADDPDESSTDADTHWMDRCATCAASLPGTGWSPVTTIRTDDGPEFHAFCDEDCQRAWNSADATTDAPSDATTDAPSDAVLAEDSF